MSPWASLEDARLFWSGAPASDELLTRLLTVAEEQCRAYAPLPVLVTDAAGVTTEVVPESWTLATVYQARELWAASKRDGDTIAQGDGYVLRARPLVDSVRQLLRPAHGRRRVG